MAKVRQKNYLRSCVLRAARAHFYLIAIFAFSIIIFDAWNYISLQNVLARWTAAAFMLIVTTIIWYASRNDIKSVTYYKGLMLGLILGDLALATFMVYNDRGMASPGVMFYAVPIVTSAILYSRRALFATAALSSASYSAAVVRYFVVYFNEGISIQLYGTIVLYSAIFFILAALLWIVLTPYHPTD